MTSFGRMGLEICIFFLLMRVPLSNVSVFAYDVLILPHRIFLRFFPAHFLLIVEANSALGIISDMLAVKQADRQASRILKMRSSEPKIFGILVF